MSRKSEYSQILDVFTQLHKKYPSYNIGRHVSTALDEYKDPWGMSDKEFLFALEKYAAELEMNVIDDDDVFLKKVIEDANHIFDPPVEDDFDEEFE